MNKLAVVPIGQTFGTPYGVEGGKTIGDIVRLVLDTSFVAAGILILFMIVFAGFKMIQGTGSGNQQDSEKAKQAATAAAIGFAIIFVSYWIIKLIELVTGSNFITEPGL